MVLRSKTPDLVKQEFFGLIMGHFATRGVMHEAALKADMDPDRLSLPRCRSCHPPQAPQLRGHSPLSTGVPSMTPCSTKFSKKRSMPAEAAVIPAASNAR
jgi:hypothetical protein